MKPFIFELAATVRPAERVARLIDIGRRMARKAAAAGTRRAAKKEARLQKVSPQTKRQEAPASTNSSTGLLIASWKSGPSFQT